MGISAFLLGGMAKDKAKDQGKEGVKLKPVAEDGGEDLRRIRLYEGKVEEYEVLPVVRVGQSPVLNEEGEPVTREDMRTRSQEPDLGTLIDGELGLELEDLEDGWELRRGGWMAVPWGWMALVVVAFATGIIWSLVQVKQSVGTRILVEKAAVARLEEEKRSVMDAKVTLVTIERVVGDFFKARSVEELVKWVRDAERVGPLMEGYYAGGLPEPRGVVEVLSLNPLTIRKHANFWLVACLLDDGSDVQVLVEVYSEDEAGVDWESYVAYQPIPWDEFVGRREGGYEGNFRVYGEEDYFFNDEFSDSEKLMCLRLTARGSEEVLYGYFEREGEVGRRIRELVDGRDLPSPMMLRLYVPENLRSPRGVVIRELLAPGWVLLDDGGRL